MTVAYRGLPAPLAERMLQAGLFDILSAIGAGTRPRAMRYAHDHVVWPLACSRRWAARNLTRGLRPPPACHALRLRSLRRVPRRSRACAATANQHAVFATARIVAVHASGLSAYAHGRRVVSEMETTRKGPMDMNDMVDTRTTGTGLAKRVRDGFLQDRRELGPAQAADKWFAPLMDRWNGLLSRDGGGFSHEERVTLAVLATEYLSMRDALILAALREMGGGELHMLYARPHSMESAAVVTCELSRAFKDADCQPDMRRWGRATALLESVTADAPDGYEAQPMAACAYLMWMADRSTVAAVRALKALALADDCSLATLVLAAGEHGIRPAWAGRRR